MRFLSQKQRISAFISALIMAAAANFGYSGCAAAQIAPPLQIQPGKPSGQVDQAVLLRPGELKDMGEGASDAPITIVEYAGLTCGHCADFYLNTMPKLREDYIKTGKVRYIMRELAVEPRGMAAAMLTRCVPEERFFPFVQLLFEKQEEWAFSPDGKTPMMRFAKMAGLDDKAFNACLANQKLLDQVRKSVEQAIDEKGDFKVRVTPTLFINGQKYEGALTEPQLAAILNKMLPAQK